MRDDRLRQLGERRWGKHLNKGIHSFGHVRHCDGPVLRGGLRTDDLAVLDDVEYSTGKRIIGIIQFDEFDLDLAVVLKNEGNVAFPVPYEGLLDLVGVRAFGEALRRSYFLGLIAPNGHSIPGHIGEVSALAGDIGPHKAVVHAGDLDNRPGEAPGGIVRVYFTDTALSGNGGAVPESNRHCVIAVAGKRDILRGGTVDLVSARRGRGFGYCIGGSTEPRDPVNPVFPCDYILREGAVGGLNMKSGSRQTL